MYDKTTLKLKDEIEKELTSRAHAAMQLPKSDPFEHGISVGEYRGLSLALQILKDVLNDIDSA